MLFCFLHLQQCANDDGSWKMEAGCYIWQIFICNAEILAEKSLPIG